jgi:hypothetical protein
LAIAAYMREFRKLVEFQDQQDGLAHFKMRLSYERGKRRASFFGRPAHRLSIKTSGPIVESVDVEAFVAWEKLGWVRTVTSTLQTGVTVFRLTELGVKAVKD